MKREEEIIKYSYQVKIHARLKIRKNLILASELSCIILNFEIC